MEEPTLCPECNKLTCYDYNGTQVCEDCYHKAIYGEQCQECGGYRKDGNHREGWIPGSGVYWHDFV